MYGAIKFSYALLQIKKKSLVKILEKPKLTCWLIAKSTFITLETYQLLLHINQS